MAETAHQTLDDEARENARRHMRAARDEFRESISSIFPPDFRLHQRKARREMLLAWRSFIDRAIQRIEEKDTGSSV
jgi:hypothetical protein